MQSYFFIPLSALILNNLTWGYVLAQKRKNPVNYAYLMLSGAFSCWLIQNLLLWLPVNKLWYDILLALNPLFWLPIGFLFLNFSYEYLNKKRNFFYFLILFSVLAAMVVSQITDLIENGYEVQPWGPLPSLGLLYYPVLSLLILVPCVYSLFLLCHSLRKTKDVDRKNQLILIITGSFIGWSIGLGNNVLLQYVFNLKSVVPLGPTGGTILSVFIFFAIIKYRFLTIGIEDIANDLFVNVQDGIIILKEENLVIQINKAAQKMFNLEGRKLSDIRITAFINDYRYFENYNNFETRILSNEGRQPRTVSLSQSTIKFADRLIGKILIIRDITAYNQAINDLREHRNHLEELIRERTVELTEMNKQLLKEISERKQKEVQLRTQEELLQTTVASLFESEERYRTLAENAFDLICEASQEGLFVYVSPNYHEVMGYDPRELVGQEISQLLHPEDCCYFLADFERAIKNQEAVQNRYRYKHKNGDWLWFESAGKPYRAPDDSFRVILIMRDITNRKKIEDEMIKANKLESIGILAGGLAHDFNNILSILWGNITMAKTYAEPDGNVNQRLVKAENALIRARELTQQLLIFAKGVEPIKKVTSIADLVLESVQFTLRGSSIQYNFAPAADLWLVEVDEGQMNQVFNNLLINAEQAMPEGGNVTIKTRNMVVTEDNKSPLLPGRYVKLSFSDNGVGIPEENLRKIFDPYFTTKPKGTGLGLATAYSIIKKHNGHIAVESELGVGTTVYLYIPASETSILSQKPLEPKVLKAQGRVLVMDDEMELQEVLAKMLNQIGYEVTTACNGTEAIQKFKQAQQDKKPFLFVIMDIVIQGGMGGKETIKHFLDINPDTVAIVSSGYSKDPVMSNFREYGFHGVLTKPYSFAELVGVIKNAVLNNDLHKLN